MPKVNPDILQWARTTAGLTPEEAVRKLQIRPAYGLTSIQRLSSLEAGETSPTRPLLLRMASQYRRPLVTFYLSSPPRVSDRGNDYRLIPHRGSRTESALLDAMLRNVRARQSMVRAVIEDEDEAEALDFVGSRSVPDGVLPVVASIRETLRLSLKEYRACSSHNDAFELLRRRTEEAGVFVLLIGNLGSHHTSIDAETFRGLALADPIAPFVVINDQDAKSAWPFTLIHELAHVWLGESGVSGERADIALEQFCNNVAGEFLIPNDEIDGDSWMRIATQSELSARIGEFARDRRVSRSMVAYRLYRTRVIDQDTWHSLRSEFRDAWLTERKRNREQNRAQEGGPNFYVVRSHRLGHALLAFVQRMVDAGALTTSKAGTVLGVKARQVQMLLESTPRRSEL